MVLNVSTPMMPMTRPLSSARGLDGHRAAHRVADEDDLLVRHGRQRGRPRPAPNRAMVQSLRLPSVPPWPARSTVTSVYLLLERRHLFAPVVRVAGPAVDEHQRRLAAAVHAVLHVHAVRRDRDARRAFGGLALVGGRGGRAAGGGGSCLLQAKTASERRRECRRECCACGNLGERRRRSHRWRSDEVRPGLSMPSRFTRPGRPWSAAVSMRKSGCGSPGPCSFGRMPV